MRILLIVLAALVAGCSGSTEPTEVPLTATVTSQVTAQGSPTLVDGFTVYQCSFPVTVTVTGAPSGTFDYVDWSGGGAIFRLTATGQQSSLSFSSGALRTIFGTDRARVGQPVTGSFTYYWNGPFTATLVLDYNVYHASASPAEIRTATVALTCQ